MYAKKSAKSLSISRTTVNIFVDRWMRNKNSNFDILLPLYIHENDQNTKFKRHPKLLCVKVSSY